ncbi:TIR domain-containing protein [Phthorimaea operculella]|nr:TIR domain-containing protein [Phthorimaea operculella]
MYHKLWTISTVLFVTSTSASEISTLVEPCNIVFRGNKWRAYSDNKTSLVINCLNETWLTDDFPFPNATLRYKYVTINQCLPETYIDKFKAINIDYEFIETLQLNLHLQEPLTLMLTGSYFQYLKIKQLAIEIFNKDHTVSSVLRTTSNVFKSLSNLSTLHVKGLEIPALSEDSRLAYLTLSGGSFLIEWGNCAQLERFNLSSYTRTDFPKWPHNCSSLRYLEIDHLLPETALLVTERMIEAAPNLHTLKMNHCRLYKLPLEMLNSATKLVHLDISDNKLYDNLFWAFPSIVTLKTLDLSRNLIRGNNGVGSLVAKLPKLKILLLRDEESVYNTCGGSETIKTDLILPLQNSSLESLDLGSTYTYLDCFEDTHFSKLKRIMIYQATGYLEPLKMPLTDARHLEIDLGPSTVHEIRFSEADYETLRTENTTSPTRNLTILLKSIRCDHCAYAWLVRALRDFPHIMSIPDLRCNYENGNPILEEPVEHMECNSSGGDGCLYIQSWSNGKVIAECSERFWNNLYKPNEMNVFKFPLYGLNVSGMGFTTLPSKWPNSQWLDLRHNRLSHGTTEQASALFSGGRRVWLDDNLLLCDCDNRPLLDAIQRHRHQVQDYDMLSCVGTSEPLSSVSTDVLCQVVQTVSLSAAGALILVIGLIVVLYRRYKEQLHVFLYSKGWCLRCLQDPDSDDKPYDAFISFAHEDQEYVMNTLLPGLEQRSEQFRICVHYRDWHVGDWIPAQIMRSVQLSKRTLIVLSRSFVASTWSTFEFR